MLKQRILTALVLIPLFVLLLFKLPPIPFACFTGLAVFWSAWEWSRLMGVTRVSRRIVYPIIILLSAVAGLWIVIPHLLFATFVWWLFAALLVVLYPKGRNAWGKSVFVRGIMGVLVLVPCWIAINYLRHAPFGIYTLLYLFVLIWGADSGAYFAGKKWGKTKLAPAVSPGKSWQGLVGALATSLVITLIALCLLHFPVAMWPAILLLAWVTVLFSILGDLFESMLKRIENMKDSGQLLPGHGGMLDRIDSLTAAAPVFALGTFLLTRFFH